METCEALGRTSAEDKRRPGKKQPSRGPIERGATAASNGIPAELSDTSYFTERALSHLEGRGDRPSFIHLGYWRPHPPYGAPAPYHDRYDPADMPAPRRARTPEEEARQHPLLDFYIRTNPKAMFFQGATGLAADLTMARYARRAQPITG